jgi:epoxyqueuosine reductase QueG
VLEREPAQRAGLGWFGRNTMLLHPRRASYFFLGSLAAAVFVFARRLPGTGSTMICTS